ncbi:MAG: apolipoprotein N-acyltransferase [Bacteroidetes bacterium]|nr:apolipoprotein N-acyltransferase [Bacteroidota bacterium]
MKKIHLIALTVLSGILLSAAWPARGLSFVIFFAWVPLLYVQQELGNRKQRGMFRLAWLSFLVWNTLTTWWIWNSTEIGAIAAIGLNSLFMALVFKAFHFTKTHLYDNKKGNLVLVFLWLAWEWFHLHWDLSWPWLNLGHVFSGQTRWIQWYEYTGVAGGSAWVLLVNILFFNALKQFQEENYRINTAIRRLLPVMLLVLLPIVISQFIYFRYEETEDPVDVVVVQPNLDPYSEQYNLSPSEVIERNLSLALRAMGPQTDYVIAPESAIQEEIWEEQLHLSPSLQQLQAFIDQHPHTALVIGASTFSFVPRGEENDPAARKFRTMEGYYYAYNTAFHLDSSGRRQLYHKSKLTPGVEKMPSWTILKPLRNYAIDLGGTVGTLKTDNYRKVFSHPQGRIKPAPVICYESVYGEFVAGYMRNGANVIFIITNDGWWGHTPGHRQHLLFAPLRAIETRRSIARSANTGISAFVDQRGDLYQKTPYWEEAVIRQKINLNQKITFYVRYGDFISRISAFLAVVFLVYATLRAYLKTTGYFKLRQPRP